MLRHFGWNAVLKMSSVDSPTCQCMSETKGMYSRRWRRIIYSCICRLEIRVHVLLSRELEQFLQFLRVFHSFEDMLTRFANYHMIHDRNKYNRYAYAQLEFSSSPSLRRSLSLHCGLLWTVPTVRVLISCFVCECYFPSGLDRVDTFPERSRIWRWVQFPSPNPWMS